MAKQKATKIAERSTSFVVVSNRLPVDRSFDDQGNAQWSMSPGGLVTALGPVMNAQGGAWVGWPGKPDEQVDPFEWQNYSVVPVELSTEDVEDFYEGMSNSTIWPLYHDCIVNPEFHREWWDAYVRVNQRFADEVIRITADDGIVWVQDYQLQLVPKMVREQRPDVKIGFFLHIPFPPTELFMQLPWRRQIIEGLLGADIVGFQVPSAASNFRALARRLVDGKPGRDTLVTADGRTVTARAYPISLDSKALREQAQSDEVKAKMAELLEDLNHPRRIFLGVDRLDYTKGLRHRVRAFGELFSAGELDPREDVYLQLATPSRERVDEYQKLHDEIDVMVGRINSQEGAFGRPPIQYLYTSVDKVTLCALYQIADVCVVTPLRDGMNLVAKEYLVAHESDEGALVLSEFAGAALELKQAYMVNPYDLNGMKSEIMKAATDTKANRSRKMRALRKQVLTHDIELWAKNFLDDLGVETDDE